MIVPDVTADRRYVAARAQTRSEVATPLSLILTELIQNAVEHAFVDRGGTVTVELKREDPKLLVLVRDDGEGLPSGFAIESGSNLGLQIVRTLLIELAGEITLSSNGGTTVELSIPLARG